MSRYLRSICLILALSVPAPSAGAGDPLDSLDKGPRVGQPIPHSLAVRDHDGQPQDFESLARRRGLILLFSRSLDW